MGFENASTTLSVSQIPSLLLAQILRMGLRMVLRMHPQLSHFLKTPSLLLAQNLRFGLRMASHFLKLLIRTSTESNTIHISFQGLGFYIWFKKSTSAQCCSPLNPTQFMFLSKVCVPAIGPKFENGFENSNRTTHSIRSVSTVATSRSR